jgi:phosphoribosylaminoimidazole-succinocarboxamide synthase
VKKLYAGKTKDVFLLGDGNYLLRFKDDATVDGNGNFDPGMNETGLTIDGLGLGSLRLTDYFFRKLNDAGIPTHFISSDMENAAMTVRPVTVFGKGLEVICRFKATGSFMRRYGLYAAEGQKLDALVEFSVKNDAANDPFISQETLEALGILENGEYAVLKSLTQKISHMVRDELAAKGMDLYDIKLEFGKAGDGGIILADEISAGTLRAYKDGKPVPPLDVARLLLS